MLLDAYAETGARDALTNVYRGLLFREGDKRLPDQQDPGGLPAEIDRDFSSRDVRKAMGVLATSPMLQAGLQPVELDLTRKDVADFNADEKRQTPIADGEVAKLRAVAEKGERLESLAARLVRSQGESAGKIRTLVQGGACQAPRREGERQGPLPLARRAEQAG